MINVSLDALFSKSLVEKETRDSILDKLREHSISKETRNYFSNLPKDPKE